MLPASVQLRDVGPRDGLQPEAPVEPAARARLVELLVAAGLRHVEVAAFVSPRAVPAMAGAAEVVAALERHDGVTYAALVPNDRGAELALAAGVDELTFTLSASETYNERNVRMPVAASLEQLEAICERAGAVPVDTVVSCAFGSPYEGEVDPEDVMALVRAVYDAGSARVTLADTTGMATPRRIDDLLDLTGNDVGLHLHDTRGTALVNAYAAMLRGVRRFDTAVGGLGGSPFAHGAGGNLATEDLVHLCDDIGVATGVDLDALLAVSAWLGGLVGRPVPSRVAAHGPRTRRAAGEG